MYGIIAEGHFDSAHFLSDYHGKCENLHGHRWRVEAMFAVPELQPAGDERAMVEDFAVVKRQVKEVCDRFDHTFLYEAGTLRAETVAALETEGFTLTELGFRPTAENFARHIFGCLEDLGLPVRRVEVDETPNNRAFYEA